jgi:hypothetical protein
MKSLFLVPTNSKQSKSRQLSELAKFQKNNSGHNGAFAENGRSLRNLIRQTRRRMNKYGSSKLESLRDAFFESKVPFCVVDEMIHEDELRTAGMIASTIPTIVDGRGMKIVDQEELTFLSVAILRRLGEPALFGLTIDPEEEKYLPLIVAVGEDRIELNIIDQGIRTKDHRSVIEVLSDEAVYAMVQFNRIISMNTALMRDMAEREEMVPNEWKMRAIGLAHDLYRTTNLWPVHEMLVDMSVSKEIFGIPDGVEINGIRHILENNLVFRLRNAFLNSLKRITEDIEDGEQFIKRLVNREHLLEVLYYRLERSFEDAQDMIKSMEVAAMLHFHTHDERDCGYLDKEKS